MIKIAGNSKTFGVLPILLAFSLFVSGQAFAWTISSNFESGTVGALAQGTSGFDYAASRTTFASGVANSGSKSAKMAWQAGDEGFSSCTGQFNFPSAVTNGGQVWARGYFYFASPWSWQSRTGTYSMIKVFRILSNSGGMDSILSDSDGAVVLGNEPAQVQTVLNASMDVNKWQCLEIYIKASATSGIFRIWKNGILVGESIGPITLASSSNYFNGIYVMSQWNNAPAQNQTEYLDDFVVTTDKPSNVDAKGNPMIGPIGWTGGGTTASLTAPTNLKVN